MTGLDYGIIALYFVIVIGAGLLHAKASSTSIESYFLGSHKSS